MFNLFSHLVESNRYNLFLDGNTYRRVDRQADDETFNNKVWQNRFYKKKGYT